MRHTYSQQIQDTVTDTNESQRITKDDGGTNGKAAEFRQYVLFGIVVQYEAFICEGRRGRLEDDKKARSEKKKECS